MFEFSLVVFNQHIFEKTNFKRIVHVIAKELNLIIAQKAITQECTIKQVRRWVVSNWQKYSVDRCGVTGNKIFVLPFYRKEVLPINLFLVSRKLEDQQIAHQICLQIFFAINYLFVKNNSKYYSILDFSCAGWYQIKENKTVIFYWLKYVENKIYSDKQSNSFMIDIIAFWYWKSIRKCALTQWLEPPLHWPYWFDIHVNL